MNTTGQVWVNAVEAIGGGAIGGFMGVVITANEQGRTDTIYAVPCAIVLYIIVLWVLHSVFSNSRKDDEHLKRVINEALDERMRGQPPGR